MVKYKIWMTLMKLVSTYGTETYASRRKKQQKLLRTVVCRDGYLECVFEKWDGNVEKGR